MENEKPTHEYNPEPVIAPQPTAPVSQTDFAAQPSPATYPEVNPQTTTSGSGMHRKRKKWPIVLAVFIAFGLLGAGAAAYYIFYVIPNKPEYVLNQAVLKFLEQGGDYYITGKLDQAGPNDPDFEYSVTTTPSKDSQSQVRMLTFLQNPTLDFIKKPSSTYIKASGFQTSALLSAHYRNVGGPGVQEAIAMFTETSGLSSNQQKWIEIDPYILSQPLSPKLPEKLAGIPGVTLNTIGNIEKQNGTDVRKYTVTLTQDTFKLLIDQIDQKAGVPILKSILSTQEVTASEAKVDIWVDMKAKVITMARYDGRPLRDATFRLSIDPASPRKIESPSAQRLTQTLSYGIVNQYVFNKGAQVGGSDNDKERIADLKAMKTALEMYKKRNGNYPDRYTMSVTQQALITTMMTGADPEVFKDTSGRYVGLSGSQYAYVSSSKNGDENCGKFTAPCEKYFLATTFDNGQKYQLNSD